MDSTREFHSAYPEVLRSAPSSSTSTSSTTRKPHLAHFPQKAGYVNPTSGWGEATRACQLVITDILSKGGRILPGKEVVGMTFEPDSTTDLGKRRVNGVRFANGEEMKGDLVVVATGAWTPALFAQPMMGGLPSVVAAGQCVAKIQLTPEEIKEYAGIPVVSQKCSGGERRSRNTHALIVIHSLDPLHHPSSST